MLRVYGKALAALLVAGLTALSSALTDGRVTSGEGIQIAIAVATAAGVWLVPVIPQWPWTKTLLAGLLAALNVAVTVIDDGITVAEGINLVLAALGVLGVGAAPAVSVGGVVSRPSRGL